MLDLLLVLGGIALGKWCTDPRVDGSTVTMHQHREIDALSRLVVSKHGVQRRALPPADWTFPPGSVGALLQQQQRQHLN